MGTATIFTLVGAMVLLVETPKFNFQGYRELHKSGLRADVNIYQ